MNYTFLLLLVLPVSSATGERSFSAMKLIKTRLRTALGDKELSKLMLLYVNRRISKRVTNAQILAKWYESRAGSLQRATLFRQSAIDNEDRVTKSSERESKKRKRVEEKKEKEGRKKRKR